MGVTSKCDCKDPMIGSAYYLTALCYGHCRVGLRSVNSLAIIS